MKKVLLIFSIMLAILLTGCSNTKGYKEISYKDLVKMENDNKTFALFIGKTSCSSCDVFKDILKTTYKEKATIYYIDTDNLTDDEWIEFKSKYTYGGTPTVTIVIDGKFNTLNSVTGSDKYEDMINLMRDKGLI